ncbi:hypothetical protein FACS189479_09450 [Spirochaetia bacterium]|nr:hypothetical protein FACS189479_09450 [Spirochaetia bacterium]
MIKLSQKKGYRFIGSNKYGSNLFFIKNDITAVGLPDIRLDETTKNNQFIIDRKKRLWPQLENAPWEKV